jgi:DNA-binding transcriptional LysR family regulator
MELEDLRIFVEVAQYGTLTGASPALHLSQPAITRRLQGLERRLGVRLFSRAGRRLQLTEAGVQLLERAQSVLGEVSEIKAVMAAYGAGARGLLRIGASVTACLYLLPPIFGRFRASHPEFPLLVRNDRSGRLGDLVHEGRIDVGVASVLAPREGLRVIPWRELELALIRPPDAGPGRVGLDALTELPVLLPSAGALRTLTDGLFARCDPAPSVVAECDSLEVVRALVASGLGQAVLPRVCVPPDGPVVQVAAFDEPLPPLPVAVLVRRARPTPRPVAAFLEALGPGPER